MQIRESSEDWWQEAHERMELIQSKLLDKLITKDEAIDKLNKLLIEIIITEKLEQGNKEEAFQYQGIKIWIKNFIDSLEE